MPRITEKIYIIDLSANVIIGKPYEILKEGDYGRGLAFKLLGQNEPSIVLVPGLFAGCPSPSCGRMTVGTKNAQNKIKISNTSGNMPQMLGSLGVCAVVIKGVDKERNAVINIDEGGIELLHMLELQGQHTSSTVSALKQRFGKDCAAIGTGIAGDNGLAASTMFFTYSDGTPEFHCPRSVCGDIAGGMGLRAVVANSKKIFGRKCGDINAFRDKGKQLTSIILDNEICGEALPKYGSAMLMHLKKNDGVLPKLELPKLPNKCACNNIKGKKINNNCAPMCVIGCLNRHSVDTGKIYDSPHECEIEEVLKERLGIDDDNLLKQIINYYRDVCLNPLAILGESKKVCQANEPENEINEIYRQALVLENLGFCLFSAFAIINNKNALQLITEMYNMKTGNNISEKDMLLYAQKCIEAEKEYAHGMPEIIRLLYKYFKNKGK